MSLFSNLFHFRKSNDLEVCIGRPENTQALLEQGSFGSYQQLVRFALHAASTLLQFSEVGLRFRRGSEVAEFDVLQLDNEFREYLRNEAAASDRGASVQPLKVVVPNESNFADYLRGFGEFEDNSQMLEFAFNITARYLEFKNQGWELEVQLNHEWIGIALEDFPEGAP